MTTVGKMTKFILFYSGFSIRWMFTVKLPENMSSIILGPSANV